MASNNSTTKNEWLVIVHDKPGMLSKRMDIRPYVFYLHYYLHLHYT